jgi:hypothetical protein
MRKPTRPRPDERPKPPKHSDKAHPTTGNNRLTEQIRKVLAKHYANKYRTR